MTGPAAGWYPDPDHEALQRYWDGQGWTDHTAPTVQPPAPVVVVTDQRSPNGVEIAIAWVLTILTVGYFLPWAIAATRGKSNSLAIGVLTFFLGWTVIGWIVALVMSCGAHRTTVVRA